MSVRVGIKLLQAVNGATTFDSEAIMVAADRSLDLTITHTSTLSGTLQLLSCKTGKTGTFTEVEGSSTEFTQPNGANAGTQELNFQNMPGVWWKIRWTPLSGAGTFTAAAAQGDCLLL